MRLREELESGYTKSMAPILSQSDILEMRKVCTLAARTLNYIEKFVKAGVTTNELDKIVHDYTLSNGAKPAPLGYNGFPKSICTSINSIICHGVPDETVIKDGDIINVDITCVLNGFYGDTSRTFLIGNVSESAAKLVEAAKEAMMVGIECVGPKAFTGDIGFAINKYSTRRGYTTVKEIGGHGIGRKFHDEPFVPSFGKKGRGDQLLPWRCITVEPMLNETTADMIEYDIPNSTIKWYETEDKSLSAQFEHTVLITDKGYEILTVD
ncbi:MAG: type I methionyl aminopeptidase [Pseudobdellovibrionaceae bacterium]